MHRLELLALATLCAVAFPMPARAQIEWPKESDGYVIKNTADVDEPAPAGYEGKIASATQIATGNTPATAGKTYTLTVNFNAELPDCPQADGTENGDGELSYVWDFKNQSASGPSTSHAEIRAKAKFKGKVDDDAKLINPVTADIDYSFTASGSSGGHGAPIASAAPTYAPQHISVPITIGGVIPELGTISGGDYMVAHYSDAAGLGRPLAFLGGAFLGLAQSHWTMPDSCAQVVFDPPSFSRQPVPGSTVKVNGYIKTKGGEGVRGKFGRVDIIAGDGSVLARQGTDETVSVTASNTDPGSPAIFVYTAPSKKLSQMGFGAGASSRAGNALGLWETGLGTNWSGQITVSKISPGVDKSSDLISAHHYEATQITINVKNGEGTADGFSEIHGRDENRHYVADGNGKSHIELMASGTDDAMAQGQVKATTGVLLDTLTHHYTITLSLAAQFPTGKRTSTSCVRGKCTTRDEQFSVGNILPVMGGKLDDLNHVSGSMDLGGAPKVLGFTQGPSTGSYIVRWDLARTGTTK